MPTRALPQRSAKKKAQARLPKQVSAKSAAAKALCTEIAMLAAAKGWGRKPPS